MAGYIGSKSSVTLVDGYSEAEADAEFVNDPNGAITVSGSNVGIGTSSPSEKLTIQSGNLNFMGGTNDAQYIKFGDTGDDNIGSILYYHGNDNMVFTNNASEAMRIDSSGNVGIGTSSIVDTAWYTSSGANTELALDGNSGYGIIHLRGTGAGSTNTEYTQGVGNGKFYMAYDAVANQHRMTVDSSGRVTTPSQPAFHYRLANGGSITTSNGSIDVTFSVSINATSGNGYNATTGRFTAPVAGWYAFDLTFYYSNGGNYVGSVLVHSSGQQYYSFDNTGADVSTPLSKILYLNAGDTIRPRYYTYQATTLHVSHSYFSGYLLG